MTDYTGVTLPDILEHFRSWREGTQEVIDTLSSLRASVLDAKVQFHLPNEVLTYIDSMSDLLARYRGDFDRLVRELPHGVTNAHVEIVSQIYESSIHEERWCIQFKRDHIEHSTHEESVRPILDKIYGESRDMLIDYRDLSNVVPRLRTFVGSGVGASSPDLITLKPSFWGVGVDVKEAARRIRRWWKNR